MDKDDFIRSMIKKKVERQMAQDLYEETLERISADYYEYSEFAKKQAKIFLKGATGWDYYSIDDIIVFDNGMVEIIYFNKNCDEEYDSSSITIPVFDLIDVEKGIQNYRDKKAAKEKEHREYREKKERERELAELERLSKKLGLIEKDGVFHIFEYKGDQCPESGNSSRTNSLTQSMCSIINGA